MKKLSTRILSLFLVLAMVASMVPATVFAAESDGVTWTKVGFDQIKPTDVVAITMTSGEDTYVLPTVAEGSSGQPLATAVTVDGNTMTTAEGAGAYGWVIAETEGGYTISNGTQYLTVEATNNGVRLTDAAAAWTLIKDGYLSIVDPNGDTRYLGVYVKGLDWRCYKAYASGNIAGQSVSFWVQGGAAPEEPVPSEPTEPEVTEPEATEPVTPDPTEPVTPPPAANDGVAEMVTELVAGDRVYIYNPGGAKVMTAEANGTQLAAVDGVVEDNQLTVTDEMVALTVGQDDDGNYTFQAPDGSYLSASDTSNVLTFDASPTEYSFWEVETLENGFYVKSVNGTFNSKQLYLEYYKNNFTTYTYTYINPFLIQFFSAGPAVSGGFTDTLAAGDRVVIYNPTHNMALSNVIIDTEKNQDLEGTEVVWSSDDTISGYTDANIWTVGVNDDGTYTFTAADGQKLFVSNRTHVSVGEEATGWTLILMDGRTDEFFVKSPVSTYLEWYPNNNCWSAYYNPSEAMYAIRFYVVGGDVQTSNVVSAPKASPKAGEVNSGTEISFTCATEGATILYKMNDGEYTEYTGPIAITEDTTFTVKAVKAGMDDSKEVTFAYTIYVPPVLGELQATLVTDASTLLPGDKILVVTSGDLWYAMGTNQKANNRGPADVIKAYDKVSYDEFAQIITLESGVKEGTFSLYATNGECPGYLYASSESGNLLRTQDGKDENASFTITIDASGNAAITSLVDKTSNTIRYNTQGIFSCYGASGQKPVSIYKLDDNMIRPGMPAEGDEIVIYNLAAKGVLSGMSGDLSDVYGCYVNVAAASIEGAVANCSNGSVIFKVEKNGEYYRFYNESFGYLCSTGTGNNTFYTQEASEDADWLVEEYNGGYKMGSRSAQFGGNMQYLQSYSGTFTTWGMYAVTDRDVFTYYFYPCSSDKITDGVVNEPQAIFGNLAPAYAGQNYALHFTVDALFGVKELSVWLGETELTCTYSNGRYTATIPAELIAGTSLTVTVKGCDNKDVEINSSVVIEVKDEPVISNVTPIANAQTKDNKRPVISAALTNVGENPTIVMTVNDVEVAAVYENGKVTYTPEADLGDGRVTVTVTVTRADGKSVSKSWSFTVGESSYTLYFGQLHAHNGEYSDGSGTLAGALEYIESLTEEANVDFVALTDHSNYFDKSGEANPEEALFDLSKATPYAQERWTTYKTTMAAFNESHTDILALAGFEMTWSGGPGHINTFNTEGIVSRNNTNINNKTADAGLQLYYELLTGDDTGKSVSQFNHPGSTFGNFVDFSYWSAEADERIHLVEVGNGEGAIGSSGYYPSYEQYTLALDKGWHIAPTNNQDNHKGKWGNANEARDVVLAEALTEEALYEAMRNYRVYSTEDRNLEIIYSVNDLPMGTIIEEVPGSLKFDINVMDPDATDSIAKVELIVNSGKVVYTWDNAEELSVGILTAELSPDYSYYYVRVTEADGDLAVTAPVWVGESLMLGISDVSSSNSAPVTGEETTISTTLYNSEDFDALVKSVIYTTEGSSVLAVDNTGYALTAGSELKLDWNYVPKSAKLTNITVTVVIELNGKEYTFSSSVELDVMDASQLTYIGIDASHNNEYVTGYNKALMNNFTTLAGGSAIRTEQLNTSEALIAACQNADGKYSAIVLNAPSRRTAEAKVYSAAELEAIAAFHAAGGTVIVTGLGDSNDQKADAVHLAAAQNELLASLGSALRLADDGTYEENSFSLTLNAYGDNALTEGLAEAGSISYYGGSSIYVVDAEGNATASIPASVSPVLFANAATYSKDADSDGLGADTVKYAYAEGDERLMVMALDEQEGKGAIIVAGSAFMNDYDLAIPATNANNALCENIFAYVNPTKITPIAEVIKQTEIGFKYTIEGVVTSNASGYDKDTAFFDCIYVQDSTGGICCFPVAGNYKVGDKVRITGTTDFYQGEAELQVTSIEVIGEGTVEPTVVTAAEINDCSKLGTLVSISGTVVSYELADGMVQTIYVKDAAGDVARVFIDGYITTASEVVGLEVGCNITVVGLSSYDNTFDGPAPRIRVRNRADVVCTAAPAAAIEAPVVTASNNAKTGKVKLAWDAVEGAVSYKVYRATSKEGTYKLMYTTSGTTYTNTKANAGQYYYYYVVAVAADGTESEQSNIAGRTCDLARPVVTASNVAKTGKVRLTWEAVEGAVEYKVYRATEKDGKYSLMFTTEGTSYTNTKAEAGVTYYYKVVAVAKKSAANSAAAEVSRTCDLPQVKVTGKVNLVGTPKLTWEKVDGAVSYKVYRAESENGTYKLMKTTTGTSYSNTNHVNGTTYYYYVVAVAENTWANSAASNVVKLTAK